MRDNAGGNPPQEPVDDALKEEGLANSDERDGEEDALMEETELREKGEVK